MPEKVRAAFRLPPRSDNIELLITLPLTRPLLASRSEILWIQFCKTVILKPRIR